MLGGAQVICESGILVGVARVMVSLEDTPRPVLCSMTLVDTRLTYVRGIGMLVFSAWISSWKLGFLTSTGNYPQHPT